MGSSFSPTWRKYCTGSANSDRIFIIVPEKSIVIKYLMATKYEIVG
jgi:hypothetical protein